MCHRVCLNAAADLANSAAARAIKSNLSQRFAADDLQTTLESVTCAWLQQLGHGVAAIANSQQTPAWQALLSSTATLCSTR
jgi:hypothetical protein